VSLFAGLAVGLFLLGSVVGNILETWVFLSRNEIGLSSSEIGSWLAVIAAFRTLVSMVAWVFVSLAIFGSRKQLFAASLDSESPPLAGPPNDQRIQEKPRRSGDF